MVGAALVRRLEREGCDLLSVSRKALDLRDQAAVRSWMAAERPQAVFVAAAQVGGIHINDTRPAEFLYDNLMIITNIIDAAHNTDVEKLLSLGSVCIYPRLAPVPIGEDALLTGPLEPTNQWYALAKIAGIRLCQAYRRQYGRNYICAMPANLYGPGDTFDPMRSHVLPALILKADQAKQAGAAQIAVWGSGKPRREFLFVDDCADALVHLMMHYDGEEHINVGLGSDLSIHDLARIIADIVGFRGEIVFDATMPDGAPRRLLDSSRLAELGWRATTPLEEGIRATYDWYLTNAARGR
jgi:GDP-L-fucose synthase